MRTRRVVLDFEFIFERVALPQDRPGDDIPVKLHRLAFPLLGVRHHLVDVFKVLSSVLQCGPQQCRKGEDENGARHAYLDISMCHKDFQEYFPM